MRPSVPPRWNGGHEATRVDSSSPRRAAAASVPSASVPRVAARAQTAADGAPARAPGAQERIALGAPGLPPNRLVLGDNLALLRSLADASVDLVYADPPFFSGKERRH